MKHRGIAVISLLLSICLMMGCQVKAPEVEVTEELQETESTATGSPMTESPTTESATTEPTPTEPEETYGPADIRTHAPEVGETYYTEQVIEESKDEALALTQEILNNPGKLFVLGVGYANPLEVLLDVDLDGEPEVISLSIQGEAAPNYRYQEIDGVSYVKWELFTLKVGDSAYEIGSMGHRYGEPYQWNVLAFSPDGTEILLGTSGIVEFIPYRSVGLYAYDGDDITSVFIETIDILADTTELGETSIIAVTSAPPPIDAPALFEWKRNSEGEYEPYYEEMYELLEEYSFMLNISIKLYSQPDLESEVVGVIGPEKVTAKKSDFGLERYYKPSGMMWGPSQSWVYLETADGTAGWTKMGGYIVDADGNVIDFFEGWLSEE